jgi:hypothetical protein
MHRNSILMICSVQQHFDLKSEASSVWHCHCIRTEQKQIISAKDTLKRNNYLKEVRIQQMVKEIAC